MRHGRMLLSILVGIALVTLLSWPVFARFRRERVNSQLRAAIQPGDVNRVRELLDASADPNLRDNPARAPRGLWQWLRFTFGPGSGERDRGWGNTMIELAAQYHHKEIVELLLDRGADPDAPEQTDITALMWVVDRPDIVSTLLKHGAKVDRPNHGGWTPLAQAVSRHAYESASLLLDAGADANHAPNSGYNLLRQALCDGDDPMARLLISHGARVPSDMTSRLQWLEQVCEVGNSDTAALLLKQGVDLNAQDDRGQTILMRLSGRSVRPEMLRLLISHGALVNIEDKGHRTALTEALIHRRASGVRNFEEGRRRSFGAIQVLREAGGRSYPIVETQTNFSNQPAIQLTVMLPGNRPAGVTVFPIASAARVGREPGPR